MEAVRLTFHNGYRHKDGTPYNPKHDDRNGFEKPKSAENNVYENYAALTYGGETFYDSEIACYEACFRPHIKAQNKRNTKARHPERNLSLKQYYEKHPPEETLLYLGNKDNNVGAEILERVFEDYRAWLQSECINKDEGCGVELLNKALHMDEATPHIQYRQIYYATDKDGNFEISQNKALAGLGFERPDMTSKTSRKNNAKVTFTAVCREKMIEIAKSYGVELITKPRPKEESGKSLEVYIAHEKLKEEREVLCAETESAKQAIQAERAELCAEKEKLAKHEQSIENAYNKLKKAIEKTKVEIKQNEEIISYQHEEIDNQKDYIAFKRAKADEKAEQEAEKAREEREELARKLREEQETNDEIIDMSAYAEDEDEEQETQNVRESIQNAPETHETVLEYTDTPEAQKPFNEAYMRLKCASEELENSNMITTEEAVALLLEP